MGEINLFVGDADSKRLQELMEEAQEIANTLRRTVTVHTSDGIVEVHYEEEKEKDVEYQETES